MIITFIYDAIVFCFRRNGDIAFSIIADATVVMNAKELRNAGQYLLALAENRGAASAPTPTEDARR